LAFNRQADFVFLEAIENVTLRNRVQPCVFDLPDSRLFRDIDLDHDAFRRVLTLETEVVEVAGVPKGVEVALQRLRVIDVPGSGEDSLLDCFGWDAAVAMNFDIGNQRLLGESDAAANKSQKQGETGPPSP
jgi:hypothetical protein